MSNIHNERVIITTDRNHAIRSATVFPIEYFSETEARPLPPKDLIEVELTAIAALFNAPTIAERDQLLADKSSLESQVALLTTERDNLASQLSSMTTDRDHLQGELATCTGELAQATSDLQSVTADLSTAQAMVDSQALQIEQLQAQLDALLNPPVNPRHLAPFDFLALLKPTEVYALQTSGDPMVVVARAKLQTIITYVDLDHPDTIALANYMESQGLLEAGRAEHILAGQPPA